MEKFKILISKINGKTLTRQQIILYNLVNYWEESTLFKGKICGINFLRQDSTLNFISN